MTETARSSAVTAAQVAVWLRDAIRSGRAAQGQRLIEADINRETGATRSRIREALQRLEVEGLVVIEEFRGASVRRFTADQIRQIYRTRMVLEGLAAHDFAVAHDPDRKARLRALQDQLNATEHTGDHAAFIRANDAWHALIHDGSGNETARSFIAMLKLPIHRLLFSTFFKPHRIDDANADHRRITDAILAGDGTIAEQLMRDHIGDAMLAVIEMDDNLPQ